MRVRAVYSRIMRVLCVGRHPFLSAHLCRFFDALGVTTRPAVGLEEAIDAAAEHQPDAVICDYDLLATIPLDGWERDPLLSRLPVIAVSLTRRPNEVHVLDVNGIAGFLYLPTLERERALQVLGAAASWRDAGVSAPASLSWPPQRSRIHT
jgi:DNA-binding NarL/FixJ family response regulator